MVIYSNLSTKNNACTGNCQCTWYWYDYDLEPKGSSFPGAYGWYGENICSSSNCYITPANEGDQPVICNWCDVPSFDGTANDQVEYTQCYPL